MSVTTVAGQGDDALFRLAQQYFSNPPARIGIAVSGGGDSMALLHLFHSAFPDRVHVVTVDHGLRPESADEAAGVARFCATRAIAHTTLHWQGPDPSGNLMDQARRARAALIADWAKSREIADVLLGHTADDQAESFLMNLARAAGLDGLSGLRPDWQDHAVHWHRPLLAIPREALRVYLRQHNVAWIDDPSNDNPRFTRVKARRVMQALAPLGITVDTLTTSLHHLAASRHALNASLAKWAETHVVERAGGLTIATEDFHALAPDLQRRFLMAVILWHNGADHPPRAEQTARLLQAIGHRRDATLGGLRFCARPGQMVISREPRAAMAAVPYGQIWDHRWQVTGPQLAGLTIAALGPDGLRLCPDWRDHGSRAALLVSPALWQNGQLIAAPLAGKPEEWRAELAPCLNSFILSH